MLSPAMDAVFKAPLVNGGKGSEATGGGFIIRDVEDAVPYGLLCF